MSAAYEYQKVRQRKFLYAGVIVLLFILGLAHRINILEASAKENSLEVSNLGQVNMGGELSRYLLASFRGPLICGLWWEAREKQDRHEFDKMEVIIEALNRLQPHFKGPWRFQGWNLSYNVAVEYDRVQDKYYYVARGIRWLYEGDRVNVARIYDRKQQQYRLVGDPDLRQSLAYTMMDKTELADEAEYFRCFLQMSCIDPVERQRGEETEEQYQEKLQRFMAKYRILTRRVQQLYEVPEGDQQQLLRELRNFLQEYRASERLGTMPSRYTREADRVFPVWPAGKEPKNFSIEEEVSDERFRTPGEDADEPVRNYVQEGFDIARRWYDYALEPLPPPNNDWSQDYDPSQRITVFNRLHRTGTTIWFRASPPRMRSRLAKSLAAIGWKQEAMATWRVAFHEWLGFGVANGLELSDQQWRDLETRATPWRDYLRRQQQEEGNAPTPAKGTPEYTQLQDSQKAYETILRIRQQQNFAHYPYWRTVSQAASIQRTREHLAEARHCWYRASRLSADPQAALAEYEKGLQHWRHVLGNPPLYLGPVDMFCSSVSMGLRQVSCPQAWTAALFYVPWQVPPFEMYSTLEQVQRELGELQQDYTELRALNGALPWMAFQHTALRLANGFSGLAMTGPASIAAAEAAHQARASWITLDRVEYWLDEMPGPFDLFFSETVRDDGVGVEKFTRFRAFRYEQYVGSEEEIRKLQNQKTGEQPPHSPRGP